ncbi:MAG: hypothetical protein CVV49_18805 [Spirochaetae bacterium HGW-Spirochaetae-5]|nr:MAG: hypothetical protein CVV49_18805 [Spirochaetae bacterium HGW-Spirochaetae-5]
MKTFRTHPGPSLWKEREGSFKQEIFCVFKRNVLHYKAPLFFIKERRCAEPVEVGAAVAGGESGKFAAIYHFLIN